MQKRDLSKTLPRFRDPAKIFRDPRFSRYHSPPLKIADTLVCKQFVESLYRLILLNTRVSIYRTLYLQEKSIRNNNNRRIVKLKKYLERIQLPRNKIHERRMALTISELEKK